MFFIHTVPYYLAYILYIYVVYLQVKVMGVPEGEATFYRREKFTLVQETSFSCNELLEMVVNSTDIENKQEILEKAAISQIFLVVKLQHLQTNKVVTIGNIHTVWNYFNLLNLSTLHVAMAMEKLLELSQGGAHIIVGDFNSTPSMGPYKLMKNGKLTSDELNELINMPSIQMEGRNFSDMFRHCYRHGSDSLRSGYHSNPIYTCIDNESSEKQCLDYIWYSSDHLTVIDSLETADVAADVDGEIRIPNIVFPSDHLSLKATFSFH